MSAKTYRFFSRLPIYAKSFKDAWLLMDRDTQADDNAEHLYRYLRARQPRVNAWFVLRKTSHDWGRLKKDGFRLLAFGSWRHRMALLNASHVVSSHVEGYVTSVLPERYYRGLPGWDFTYLKHGVIGNDLSEWLNRYRIQHFITCAPKEYEAISADDSAYKFSRREVVLTGLPRHDRLYEKRTLPQGRTILIMPTWRKSLVGTALDNSNDWEKNPTFVNTQFFQRWFAFISSPKLMALARKYGYEVVFFPHANLRPYLDEFRTAGVRVLGHADVASIQDLFLESSLLITDYSSTAFEMAYLERAILYYQFDREFVFGGGHTVKKGYFDFWKDGFGPVSTQMEPLLDSLESLLKHDCVSADPYRQRMREFFAFRDGRCCERVFECIRDG